MTKGELARKALKLIGVNTRFSEASPEEVQDALGYLEDYMAGTSGIGLRVGYYESDGEPNPDDDSGIPTWAVMGITNSLAIYLAPYYDKQPHPSIARNAALGMATIASRTVEIQPVQYPSRMPRGSAGNTYRNKFYREPERIITSNDFLTDEGDEPITS